jgi:hypothetical protein
MRVAGLGQDRRRADGGQRRDVRHQEDVPVSTTSLLNNGL